MALQKERPEGTLNNWVADVMEQETEKHAGVPVDFFVSNFGGIRINTLAAGPVTVGSIFELMPFDNQMVMLQIPGDTLQKFVDLMAMAGGWAVSEELRMTIDNQKAINVSVHGVPLESSRMYTVGLSDYIANGGDNCTFLKGLPRKDLKYLVRNALIDHVRWLTENGMQIAAVKDGRVKLVGMQ
jgi:2',3'-cyclic-nucleotide 2'-phosphodiesterase (5'-nucleotidase family)